MPDVSDADAICAGKYVRCSLCGQWVGPSDPAWLPDERSNTDGVYKS